MGARGKGLKMGLFLKFQKNFFCQMVDFKIPPLSSPFFRLYAGIFLWFFEDCLIFCDFFNGLAFTWALMGESGERGWILVIDVSSDRPMGSDHTLNQNFSHKEFFKKYSYLVILNRLEETNISICFSINRFFKASSLSSWLRSNPPSPYECRVKNDSHICWTLKFNEIKMTHNRKY